ncbi:polyphenol oxidase family protein [Nocardioides deserti]|uniref:Polyphenol oxidase family protein n=1 Tax=Nocardioides deserti TaxID=1588644 RepID=A0ABR6U333_9ACTN|nr:polyphenol oxidase family protein [Nocardioides deserti]MBC2958790.1 polyphenol oxidase family protein [Nocardioides deserti]GGO69649.1 laccase domain protein [Nocardioides deserti]
MYAFRTTHGPAGRSVELAFTDRLGGVSAAPWDELDLAIEGDDPEEARTENLRRVLADFAPDAALADLRQVHGREVVTADGPVERVPGDGLVTTRTDVVLMVRAADCVPVLLSGGTVVGAAHAGRVGVTAGVVPATVERMRELGATDVVAWIGPHVCGSCYEVPQEMQEEVGSVEPTTVATTTWGTPSLALGAGVRAQLERLDVEVVDVSRCTVESPDLYSHRRDGRGAGRHAGLVRRLS